MRAVDEPSFDGENNILFKTNTWWSPPEIFNEYENKLGQIIYTGYDFMHTNDRYDIIKKERRMHFASL